MDSTERSSSGRHQLIGIERAGNSLSENGVFDGSSYPATAQAVVDTTLLRLEAEHFRRICLQRPEVALKVIKVLGHRLRRMGQLVEELSFSTVRGRLIAHLLSLAGEAGRPTDTGPACNLNSTRITKSLLLDSVLSVN